MSTKSITLLNLFIFNPKYGPVEGEEPKKILYYYPDGTDLDTRVKNVGLCEALIKFTESFNSEQSCDTLHTQKSRQIYLQPERGFWMVMTVSIPSQQKTKNGQTYVEYLADDVQDHVLKAVLKTSYSMFKLFMGTFGSILEKSGKNVDVLKQKIEYFFRKYLPSLRLHHADLLDVFQGIHFLPLDKHAFLKVQSFVNLMEATFSPIKYTSFLYNDQLVWSGLDQDDMQVLYKYITSSLIPSLLETELQGAASPTKCNASGGSIHYGRFMTGPGDTVSVSKLPKVFVGADAQEECYLLVYRALSATVCMLIDTSCQLDMNNIMLLDGFLGPQLTSLASEINEQYSKLATTSTIDNVFKYVYFNHMNFAQKTTIHSDRKIGGINIPHDILRLMADINLDLSNLSESGEIIMKTTSEFWLVGKLSDRREFYVVLLQKSANIIEVNDEVKRLCATHFQNIFFLD